MLARVLAVSLCLSVRTSVCSSVCLSVSVCLSQVGVLSKQVEELNWVLAWELPSTSPTVCYKKIQVPSKIRVFPSGTLLQTLV